MEIKDTKERAELILQLNRVGDYSTHKELWDAYYKFEELVKNCSIPVVVKSFYCQSDIEDNGKCDLQCEHCQIYYSPLDQ